MNTEKIVADLSRPEAYRPRPTEVELVQTHISWVFLAGDLVYKVKKPVDFGFLDFTTLEKREKFCQEEVRLNRRLSPDIYLGVVGVTREADGRLVMEGRGQVADYAVKMRRLPAEGMMLNRLAAGQVTRKTMEQLAALLADFYRRAETGEQVNRFGRPEQIKINTDENFVQTADYVDVALSPDRYETIRCFTDDFLENQGGVLYRRIEDGRIRDCHGDLHMANICLGEKTWIFDCIEFNQRFRYSDVASDLAFLAMDLDFHGRDDLGRELASAYIKLSDDLDLPLVLDFYKCYRAYVRGKISCFTFDQPAVPVPEREKALNQAKRYFGLAYTYAGGSKRPRIIVFFGLMGSGKTRWAEATGRRIEAAVISSDRVRKQMAGLCPGARVYVPYGQGLYSSAMSQKVYQTMHGSATKLAGAGMNVVVDGSYMKEAERRALIEAAGSIGAEVTFVLTRTDEETTMSRLKKREERGHSLSDGRREIYAAQMSSFEPLNNLDPARVVTLDTSGPLEQTEVRLWSTLGI